MSRFLINSNASASKNKNVGVTLPRLSGVSFAIMVIKQALLPLGILRLPVKLTFVQHVSTNFS